MANYIRILLAFILAYLGSSLITNPPTWITSTHFRAGNRNVISSLTTSSSTPTYPFTFSSALSAIPLLGYGIKDYKGGDFLVQQRFQIQRTGLTASSFTVKIQIVGVTSLWILNVAYIAIDPLFPHQISTFDNVPVNYNAGALSNISTSSTSPQRYTNTINYTIQAGALSFNKFTAPYTSNKVLLLMTSIYLDTWYVFDTQSERIYLVIDSLVISQTQYQITVDLQLRAGISKLHFSQIIFNEAEIQNSLSYALVYQYYEIYTTQFFPVPQQFVDNFIFVLTDFSTEKGWSILVSHWDFATEGGVFGVRFPTRVTQSTKSYGGNATISRAKYLMFYLKTWSCPAATPLYDKIANLCTQCPIVNCMVCQTISICRQCDSANHYYVSGGSCLQCDIANKFFLNESTQTCQTCSMPGCIDCASLTQCSVCNQALQYFLNTTTKICVSCPVTNCLTCLSINQCSICDEANNYFLNITTQQCVQCPVDGCLICDTITECNTCDQANDYFLNVSDPTSCVPCPMDDCLDCSAIDQCAICDEANNYFLNTSDFTCIECPVANCIICQTFSECSQCNQTDQYFLNVTDGQCQPCPIDNCNTCLDFDRCSDCNQTDQFFLNITDGQCVVCPPDNCILCESFVHCQLCNETEDYFLNVTDKTCHYCPVLNCLDCSSFSQCILCNETDGWFLNQTNGQCSLCPIDNCLECDSFDTCLICNETNGYYLTLDMQQCIQCPLDYCLECDKVNQCLKCDYQSGYCLNQLTKLCVECTSMTTVTIQQIAQRTGCNSFNVSFFVEQYMTASDIQKYGKFENLLVREVTVQNFEENPNIFTLQVQYSDDLPKIIYFTLPNSQTIQIPYDMMIPPLKYTNQECKNLAALEQLFLAVEIMSYIILALSCLASCKIVGLELFGLLQLAYFNLADNSFINLYLSPLMGLKSFNGLNISLFQDSNKPPSNISQLDLSSQFLNNCNIMLFLLLAQMLVGVILYAVSKIIKKGFLQNLSSQLLKQGLITFILFNVLNLTFSAGVHWLYTDGSEDTALSSIFLYVSLGVIITAAICIEVLSNNGYGEFKQKFKPNWPYRSYILIYMSYRVLIGMYMALQNEYEQATIIIIGFEIFYCIYLAVNQPFTDFYQNYRAGFICMGECCVLLVTNYYRSMKSSQQIDVKGRIHTPAQIQIVIIIVCVGFSSFILTYQIYKWISEKFCNPKRTKLNERSFQTQADFAFNQPSVHNNYRQ